jgi:hypothetical protein
MGRVGLCPWFGSKRVQTVIESAAKILLAEIGQAVKDLYENITPIFDVNDNKEAELNGSAVLFNIGDGAFLATAKHVLDANARSSLFIDADPDLQLLEGDFYATQEHDVAVLKLRLDQVRLLSKYKFLEVDQLGDALFAARCRYGSCVGYPASKNKKVFARRALKRHVFSYSSMGLTTSPTRIGVPFRKSKNIDALTGQLVTSPHPYGMSGGALYGVDVSSEGTMKGKPSPKLIGILIEWRQAENLIHATPLSIVLAIVRDAFGAPLPPRLAVASSAVPGSGDNPADLRSVSVPVSRRFPEAQATLSNGRRRAALRPRRHKATGRDALRLPTSITDSRSLRPYAEVACCAVPWAAVNAVGKAGGEEFWSSYFPAQKYRRLVPPL